MSSMAEFLQREMKTQKDNALTEIMKLERALAAMRREVEQDLAPMNTQYIARDAARIERALTAWILTAQHRTAAANIAAREEEDRKLGVQNCAMCGKSERVGLIGKRGECEDCGADFDSEKSEEEPCRAGTPGCSVKHRRSFETCETY